jgi:hypothetical protein
MRQYVTHPTRGAQQFSVIGLDENTAHETVNSQRPIQKCYSQ